MRQLFSPADILIPKEELLEKWTEETKITLHKKVWNKISVQGLKVNYIEDKVEETEK